MKTTALTWVDRLATDAADTNAIALELRYRCGSGLAVLGAVAAVLG